MTTLNKYLDSVKPGSDKNLKPYYIPDGDFIQFFWKEDRCYAQSFDNHTFYYSNLTGELVGIKIPQATKLIGKDK